MNYKRHILLTLALGSVLFYGTYNTSYAAYSHGNQGEQLSVCDGHTLQHQFYVYLNNRWISLEEYNKDLTKPIPYNQNIHFGIAYSKRDRDKYPNQCVARNITINYKSGNNDLGTERHDNIYFQILTFDPIPGNPEKVRDKVDPSIYTNLYPDHSIDAPSLCNNFTAYVTIRDQNTNTEMKFGMELSRLSDCKSKDVTATETKTKSNVIDTEHNYTHTTNVYGSTKTHTEPKKIETVTVPSTTNYVVKPGTEHYFTHTITQPETTKDTKVDETNIITEPQTTVTITEPKKIYTNTEYRTIKTTSKKESTLTSPESSTSKRSAIPGKGNKPNKGNELAHTGLGNIYFLSNILLTSLISGMMLKRFNRKRNIR